MAGRYLTFEDRKKLENLYETEESLPMIAKTLGVHLATIYRELDRGKTGVLNDNGQYEYRAEIAQMTVNESMKRRGRSKEEIAREYLGQIREVKELIDNKKFTLEHLRSAASTISSPNSSGMQVDGSKDQEAGYAKRVQKIVDLEKEIEEYINYFIELESEIFSVIKKVKCDTEREILKNYYLELMTWEQVAEKMNYTERHVKRLYREALKNVSIPQRSITRRKMSENVQNLS